MPKYYGCPCEGCGKPLTLQDDIVVCPTAARLITAIVTKSSAAASMPRPTPPDTSGSSLIRKVSCAPAPACGERTLRSESVCRCCGAALPPEGAQEPADRADSDEHSEEFDYSTFYRQFQETGAPQVDPLRQTYQAAFGKEEVMDGIPCKDWADFIGPASPAYLSAYCRMQLSHTKTSMSFSAMLFGPFYFFYRKAWKPAFAFLAAELVLALPTFIDLLQVTDSSLAPGLSTSTLLTLSRVCSVLSFLLMIVRGLYGKWLYRQSAAEKIRRIRAEFPDAAQRKAVLCAQGGTSWAAVLGCLVLLMVIGSAFTLLLGPNVDALIHLVYG